LVVSNGFYSTSSYGGSYTDGIVVDYLTGNGRISVGGSDSLTLYTGGIATNAVLTLNLSGAVGVGVSPSYGTTGQVLTSQGSGGAPQWATSSGVTKAQAIAYSMTLGF
jgi:hypothetical protein